MSDWLPAMLPVLLATVLVVLPGLAISWTAGLPLEAAVGTAPAVSLGVLALAVISGTRLGVSWGLAWVGGVTVVLVGVALMARLLLRRVVVSRPALAAEPPSPAPPGWQWWYAGGLVVAAVAGGYVIAQGIGSPDAINQTFDAPFHINAIANVAAQASASPAVVSAASGGTGFYPPLFHGIAGLLVMVTGISPIIAANVVSVVIAAVMWPLSVAVLVRVVVGRSRLGHVVAMSGAVLVSLFPALLLLFGVLWPNALSIAVVPGVVALLAVVLRLGGVDLASWPLALFLGALTLPGLYYAHPGAAFVVIAMALPMVLAAELRVVQATVALPGRRRFLGPGLLLGTAVAAGFFWWALRFVPGLDSVRNFDWPARATPAEALGEVLTLASPIDPDLWIYGLLVVVGLVAAVRIGKWWVAGAHVLLGWLAILAIAYEGPLSQQLTGFWYNDPYRIMAPLAVTALPLAALGAIAIRDALARRLARVPVTAFGARTARLRTHAVAAATAVLTIAVALLVPDTFGLSRISSAVAQSYGAAVDRLVSPGEQRLYSSLASRLRPGQTIVGNPWGGEVYAGVLSGHGVIWTHLSVTDSPDRRLLSQRFKDFASDPAVCAAVKRLKIGVVVEDTHLFWQSRGEIRVLQFPGLTGLSRVPGLTRIGQADSTTAYAVGDCRT